jgi:hypothetical protein
LIKNVIERTRLCTLLPHTNTGNSTGKHVLRIFVFGLKHFITLDARYRSGQSNFLLCTVAYHNDFSKLLHIGRQRYIYNRL